MIATPMHRAAEVTPDGKYRYRLYREWCEPELRWKLPPILWLMLNPSWADADRDDPTLRKVVGFSQRWGYGALYVGNLLAYRSQYAGVVHRMPFAQSQGPRNLEALADMVSKVDEVVCAWGGLPPPAQRWRDLVHNTLHAILPQEHHRRPALYCLGLTADGWPRHPCRLAYATHRLPMALERGV